VSFKPFLAYSASAGSGKTFALSARYISLLFMGESPSHILAATFTNKAASEMRQRVIDSLKTLGENKNFLELISSQTSLSCEDILKNKNEILNKFLTTPSYIITLDSFFVSILRSASLELGLEPDFVTKEIEDEGFEFDFVSEVIKSGDISLLVKLALDIEDKKFTKIFQIMEDFYRLDPLLIEPTDNIGYTLSEVELSIELLRDKLYNLLSSVEASKTAINNFAPTDIKSLSQKKLFSKTSLMEHRNYKKYVKEYPEIEEDYQELKKLIGIWFKIQENIILKGVFKSYIHYKNITISRAKSNKVLTFDDLSYFTYRLLYESISKEFLYFKLDTKFHHILLDEFQDTSTIQYLMLKPLIDEIFSGSGQHSFKSFFYVGDKKQSLYRFRGGVEELFDKVAQDYGIEIENMDTNYRSASNIVNQVNLWFKDIMEDYVPQKSFKTDIDGYVEVIENDELIQEAIAQIKKLLNLNIDISDIALLVNTNSDGQELQEACYQAGIDTILKTSSSIRNLSKVSALVAMVEYLVDGHEIDLKAIDYRVDLDISKLDFDWFDISMPTFNILHKLIEILGYFDDDRNLLKLLEFASIYPNVLEFIKEFKTSKISIASNTIVGAKIMTIHGSKGLEFDYVIVLDKFKKPNINRKNIILGYDNKLNLERVFYKFSQREFFDTEYKEQIEHNKILSKKDRLNVIYVAFTRAIKALIIIKKEKSNFFDLIKLEPIIKGSLDIANKSRIKAKPNILYRDIGFYGLQNSAIPQKEKKISTKEIEFGNALHYMLEMLNNFEIDSIGDAYNAMYNKFAKKLTQNELQDIYNRIEMLLKDTQFLSLIKGANIYKEQTIAYRGEVYRIDLILEYDEKLIVIDYKSSTKNSYNHQKQVQKYMTMLQEIKSKDIIGAILYILEKDIEISLI
jgi:exodeoxyribonuclease V beta subunit